MMRELGEDRERTALDIHAESLPLSSKERKNDSKTFKSPIAHREVDRNDKETESLTMKDKSLENERDEEKIRDDKRK